MRIQVELLNRKCWNTRLELANAIFEYLEFFHNWQRRHSSLGMLSPVEFELRYADTATRDQSSWPHETRGTREPPRIPGRFNSTAGGVLGADGAGPSHLHKGEGHVEERQVIAND